MSRQPSKRKKDFFISYASVDEAHAKEIASTLTTAGYSVELAAQDFSPGGSFVANMHDALIHCRRLIPVLSPAYFQREWTRAEWQSFMTRDPDKSKCLIVPVRTKKIKPQGLFADHQYIDWVGKSPGEQRDLLLVGVKQAISAGKTPSRISPNAHVPPTPPAEFLAARDALCGDVKTIPIFGHLYPPIPMEQNFLRLSLSMRETEVRPGYYQWEYAELGRHTEIKDKCEFPDLEDEDRHELLRGDRSNWRDVLQRLPADELARVFPTAVIAGLPGAGKTTILRHVAWRVLRDKPSATVVYVEAKHLTDAHIKPKGPGRGKPRVDPYSDEWIFRVIASLFLHPGVDFAKLTASQLKAIGGAADWLLSEWKSRRATVLLDALDEGPNEPIRQWLAAVANRLMGDLWPRGEQEPTQQRTRPEGACYLTLRAAELERPGAVILWAGPVFLVNALDQEQIRDIARRQLALKPERFDAFDQQLPYRQDIQKVAGTPLTALLIVVFYEFFGRFERRFITYQLLVAFVLDRAWQRIKNEAFGSAGQGLSPFMQQAREPGLLLKQPELDLQYRALAHTARRSLYHQVRSGADTGRTERAIHRVELRDQIEHWIKQAKHEWLDVHAEDDLPWPKEAEAERWIKAWETENLLLPSGPERVVFMHSTVLEFFAAVGVKELLDRSASPSNSAVANEIARVFDERSRDPLETLPILCSHSQELGWRVLLRLQRAADETPPPGVEPFAPEATLPFRCLAETELAEFEELEKYRDELLRREIEDKLDAHDEKAWAYGHVERWVRGLPAHTDPQRLTWLDERLEGVKDSVRLGRDVLLTKWLANWHNDGTAVAKKQAELLEAMFARHLEDAIKPRLAMAALVPPTDGVAAANAIDGESSFWELLTRIRGAAFAERARRLAVEQPTTVMLSAATGAPAGSPFDQNLTYYRAAYSPAIAGFFGSPNFRHSGTVYGVAYSPDSKLAVSSSSDHSLILWDVKTGRELRRFEGHQGEVICCAFSPDGLRVLSGCADSTLKLWDAQSGAELRTFAGHTEYVKSCAFSGDGLRVLSGSDDCTPKLWDAQSGTELRTFSGHAGYVLSCAFSGDGLRVLSGSTDSKLKLWDAQSGAELHTFTGHAGSVLSCAFSGDGRRVLSGSADSKLKLWDAQSGDELHTFTGHAGMVMSCAFSGDGLRVLSGSADRMLKLWDAQSGAELCTFAGHANSVKSCAFSGDGLHVLSGSADRTLRLWDAQSGAELRPFAGHAGMVMSCAFSSDGRRMLSGSVDRTLKLWDAQSGAERRTFAGHAGYVMSCAFSDDGRRILSGSTDNTLKLWDAQSGAELRPFAGHADSVQSCAFSGDGLHVLSGSADRTLKLWDAQSGAERRTFAGHAGYVMSCAFSGDGRRILSGSADNTLKLWDAQSGAELRTFAGHAGMVMSCAFSVDGLRVLSGSKDRTLKLWDAQSGAELRAFAGHADSVMSCAFSVDGLRVLSGSYDRTLKLWDAQSGAELGTWNCGWTVQCVAIHPQQPALAIAALANGTVALIDLRIS